MNKNIEYLITNNEGLIYSIINKYQKYFELEDLYQVAVIGLIKAYKNYHEAYNTKFTTYAFPYIKGEVLCYVNNNYNSLKVSPKIKKMYYKILKAQEILSQRLMKKVTINELSIFLEMDESLINDILLVCSRIDSLDNALTEDNKNLKLYDTLGYLDLNIENYLLKSELEKLTEEEKMIIKLRYYADMSQREVGQRMGMYQVEVSRKEKKILERIHKNLA